MNKHPLIVILGATASGKTRLAVSLAQTLKTEIISADSRQVFKGMDIGTGKDLSEYEAAGIPYHLIDVLPAGENYHVHQFKEDFYRAFEQIGACGKIPVLCGGTGMYIHSILQSSDFTAVPINSSLRSELGQWNKMSLSARIKEYPDVFTRHVDFTSSKRLIRAIEVAEYLQKHPLPQRTTPGIDALVIGLADEIEVRREKIKRRLDARLAAGLIEEVQGLTSNGISFEQLIFYGLEYKYVVAYLKDEMNYVTFKERLITAICQYAKRQMTFFRKMEKDGIEIQWLDASQGPDDLKDSALKLIHAQFDLK